MKHDLSTSAFIDNGTLKRKMSGFQPGIPKFKWLSVFYRIPMTLDLRARNGTFTTPWAAPVDELFRYRPGSTTLSLADVYDRRAVELFSRARESNKNILIQWSGGVDSTAMLSAFLRNMPQQDHDMITVAMSSNSVIENFDFYRDYIKDNLKIVNWLDVDVSDRFLDQTMLLHGDPANCLFGPSGMMYSDLVASGRHLDPWQDHLSSIANAIDRQKVIWEDTVDIGHWYVDKISSCIGESGFDGIKTVADWWWWNYYNFRWFASIVRPLVWCRRDHKQPISRENYAYFVDNTFYAGKEFQDWSYTNLPTLISKTPDKTFKVEAKQYIYDFDKNEIYRAKKRFQASRNTNHFSWEYSSVPVYFDHNWVGYCWEEPGVKETVMERLDAYTG